MDYISITLNKFGSFWCWLIFLIRDGIGFQIEEEAGTQGDLAQSNANSKHWWQGCNSSLWLFEVMFSPHQEINARLWQLVQLVNDDVCKIADTCDLKMEFCNFLESSAYQFYRGVCGVFPHPIPLFTEIERWFIQQTLLNEYLLCALGIQ